jgi:hypothetical protein
MIMLHMTQHQTFTFGLARTCSMTLCGCCYPHIRTLCLFTAPASSENMMFVRKLGSLPIRSSMSQAKLCPLVSAPAKPAPSTHRHNRFRRTLCTVARGNSSSREARRIDFVGLRMNAIRTFSTIPSEARCRSPLYPFKMPPVSRNLLCHALILFPSGVAF